MTALLISIALFIIGLVLVRRWEKKANRDKNKKLPLLDEHEERIAS